MTDFVHLQLMILLMSLYHLKSCFSNQLIKRNESFLSLELCFKIFIRHLSQSSMAFCDTKKEV